MCPEARVAGAGVVDGHPEAAPAQGAQRRHEVVVPGDGLVLVVPSAALPGTQNLVVFGSRAASPYQVPPVDRSVDVPTSMVADNAQPHPDLSRFVRFRDDVHQELAAWLAGHVYLAEPQIGVLPARPRF